MDTNTISKADLSQQLQDQGQQLVRNERLVAGKKETLSLCGSSLSSHLWGRAIYVDWAESDSQFNRTRTKATNGIEQEATTFVVTKGQKGGTQQ